MKRKITKIKANNGNEAIGKLRRKLRRRGLTISKIFSTILIDLRGKYKIKYTVKKRKRR